MGRGLLFIEETEDMKKFLRLGERLLPITLCGEDIGKFALVLHSTGSVKGPPEMPAWTEKAGRIFKEYIYLISGIELSVYYDIYPLKREHEILIGGTLRSCDDTASISFDKEEYRFYTREGNLIINGGRRGILYGVYTFLEKYCGVRYLTDTVEKILDNEKIIIEEIEENYKPVFEYRELCDWNAWQSDFSVKMKLNGNFVRKLREEDGYHRP
mgnify:CR=1 FL=1|jgi:hypothetical protein